MGRILHKIAYDRNGRPRPMLSPARRLALLLGNVFSRIGGRMMRFGLATGGSPAPVGEPTYADRMASEIERFSEEINVHDLPDIFHYWSNRFLRPKLEAVFEVSSPDDFYLKYITETCLARPAEAVRVASLGAGNGDTEARLAQALLARGVSNFRFECLDINAAMLKRGEELARSLDISEHMRFQRADLSDWHPEQTYPVVMANHVLHHIVPLEAVFDNVHRAIGEDGCFLTCDMIGRNGHMRWPEALAVIHDLWRNMPDRYKFNHQLNRFESMYINWDCSKAGFEGIRAQDILPLLVQKFQFESFVGFGNLPDIFIERGFGHNFRVSNAEDLAFIDRVGTLNDELIDSGAIKPTQMVAVLRAAPCTGPRSFKHWTPQFCVRRLS